MVCNIKLSLQQPDRRHAHILQRHWVFKCIRSAIFGVNEAEFTVRIVDKDEGRHLNLSFRDKNYATNVLTFSYDMQPILVADLVLCAEVIELEALEQGKSILGHYAHMLVHGTLHAQGWDHETEPEALIMESLESEILARLNL